MHFAGQPVDGVLLAPDGAREVLASGLGFHALCEMRKPFFTTISSPARLTSASIFDSSTRSERLAERRDSSGVEPDSSLVLAAA